jgi:hypothetical protein
MSGHKTLGESLSERIEQADTIIKGILADLREGEKRYVPEPFQKDEIRKANRRARQLEEAEKEWSQALTNMRIVAR